MKKKLLTILLSMFVFVTTFSVNVYAEEKVAKIGSTEYASLADAIAAVPDNTETTIQMIADETFADNTNVTIAANQKIILDLNGKTITGKNLIVSTWAFITNNGTLTITDNSDNANGKITSSTTPATDGFAGHYTVLNKNKLTLEKGTIEETSEKIGGGVNLKWALRNEASANQKVSLTINGGKVIGEYNALSNYVYDNTSECICRINGGSIITTGRFSPITMQIASGTKPNLEISISGGEFIVQNIRNTNTTGNAIVYCDDQAGKVTDTSLMKFNITGGKFDTYNTGMIVQFDDFKTETATPTKYVSGGIISNEIEDKEIAEGYECVANDDDATKNDYHWKIGKIEVAKINDITYPSLEAAIAKVKNNETIVLLKDVTVESAVENLAGKTFTIDLNDKNMSTTKDDAFTIETTNLTVKNGTIEHKTTWEPFFLKGESKGSLTLDNVDITSSMYSVYISGSSKNKNVTINNCHFTSTGDGVVFAGGKDTSNAINITDSTLENSSSKTAVLQLAAKATLEKVTITSTSATALVCYENTDLLLKGTENSFTGATGAISTNGSKDLEQITIEGGTYKTTGTSKEAGIAFYHPDGSPLTIEGGTFEGATALYVKGGTIDIQGGSFIGTGNYAAAQEVKSGACATGDAVVIEASNYLKEESYPHDPNPSVSISGGLFTSEKGSPVGYYEFDGNKEAHEGKMISGGWFSSKVPNTAEKDLVVSGYKASDSLKDKGAPNATNVYTVIKDIPTENLENKETGKVTVDNKTIDTTFGTMVTIDETLPNIQVSNLNKAINTAEKKKAMNDAVFEANDGDKVEVEVIMNVELAKSGKIESLAEEIYKDKAGQYKPEDVEYIDITIDKLVKANGNVIEIEEIKETDTHQIISFPIASIFETSPDKEKVFVYRNHKIDENNEENVPFTKVEKDYGPSYNIGDGECYWLDGDYIYIKAKKFSVYGFGVQNSEIVAEKKPTPTPGPTPSSDPKPRYKVPNTGVEGAYSNNHSLLKLSSLSLLAIGTYMVIKKKKNN